MENKKKYLLIVNPVGGSGKTLKALPEIESIFRKRGLAYEFHFTQEPMHATELVKELADDFDVIVAVGGDGTINEIINGLPELNKPFGLIPIGTGNDFARSCCIPLDDPESAIDILIEHNDQKIDVGLVNERRFVNVLGLGFEGRANEVGRKLSFIKGSIKYLLAIAWVLIFYKRIPIKLEAEGISIDEDIYLISIGNGWNVGGGLQLTPKAKLEDGFFDLCIVRNISRWTVIKNFSRLLNGTIDVLDEIEIFRVKSLKVTGNKPIPMHLDGEKLGGDRTSLDVSIIPKSQRVIGNWSSSSYVSR